MTYRTNTKQNTRINLFAVDTMFWRKICWIFLGPKRPVSGPAFSKTVQNSRLIKIRHFNANSKQVFFLQHNREKRGTGSGQWEVILPLSIPRLGRRIDQPADCSSLPRSRQQCCINIEHETFLFLRAPCASRWVIRTGSYFFRIRIRGSVILDNGSGSQLITDPTRPENYLGNAVAIGKIMLSNNLKQVSRVR
jgi:hypothetical protein